jgi:hypothetical protein
MKDIRLTPGEHSSRPPPLITVDTVDRPNRGKASSPSPRLRRKPAIFNQSGPNPTINPL